MLPPRPAGSTRPPPIAEGASPPRASPDGQEPLVESTGSGDEEARLTPEAALIYAGWAQLVERIRFSQTDGMAELYHLFSKGVRFYLCRQLGIQELDDKVHDIFVVVVQAIRRGELREPERLMGFVRTVVRRQVAAHIDKAVQARREQMDLDASSRVPDPSGNPEEVAIFNQKEELVRRILAELSSRDREIPGLCS
jgi:RNA polymerase sigma-70 factor, ECF subfamily